MERKELFQQLWEAQDEAYDLMLEYDTLPHYYGVNTLYQAEAYVLMAIGREPGITSGKIAEHEHKTASATSQIVRKLIDKNLVTQERNAQNKRVYNLYLTPLGEQVHKDHVIFNRNCQNATLKLLDEFSEDELRIGLRIQQKLNEAYRNDVKSSREHFSEE